MIMQSLDTFWIPGLYPLNSERRHDEPLCFRSHRSAVVLSLKRIRAELAVITFEMQNQGSLWKQKGCWDANSLQGNANSIASLSDIPKCTSKWHAHNRHPSPASLYSHPDTHPAISLSFSKSHGECGGVRGGAHLRQIARIQGIRWVVCLRFTSFLAEVFLTGA